VTELRQGGVVSAICQGCHLHPPRSLYMRMWWNMTELFLSSFTCQLTLVVCTMDTNVQVVWSCRLLVPGFRRCLEQNPKPRQFRSITSSKGMNTRSGRAAYFLLRAMLVELLGHVGVHIFRKRDSIPSQGLPPRQNLERSLQTGVSHDTTKHVFDSLLIQEISMQDIYSSYT
jgi:hypothetical protein